LDVGGGIGVIHHELLSAGARSAIHVDATDANIQTAEEEARRRGHLGAVTFVVASRGLYTINKAHG
jgi:2-polyprenyl-3-methyl-5-hydroxy-6-metoxy-1,4-benzoquinol methylase